MKAVWKFDIQVEDEFTVTMPVDAEVVHVTNQHERARMWAIVDLDGDEVEERTFYVRGTGHQVDDSLEYLGSFQLRGGNFVGHLFQVPPL